MEDRRGPFLQLLAASGLPRSYWVGVDPEDPSRYWYFETVQDRGERVAVRQVTVDSDGQRHAYSADHLEDEQGFLTDQPLRTDDPADLVPTTAERFAAAFSGLVLYCPRCGDLLSPIGSSLGCRPGAMELSQAMEARLIRYASSPPVAETLLRFRVGGRWHCPADATGMIETDGHLTCPACHRALSAADLMQLVELHPHSP